MSDFDPHPPRPRDYSLLLLLSPLLLPVAVLAYVSLNHQGSTAPSGAPDVSGAPEATMMAPAPPIQWSGSLDWALNTARSSNKPIMVEFYADW